MVEWRPFLEFTMGRRMALTWLRIALTALIFGEYRVKLDADGEHLRFRPKDRRHVPDAWGGQQ